MGNARTLIAWLVVLGLQLVPHVTYADDVGPGREVRAIRHALPILLAHQLRASGLDPKTLVVDSVQIEGDHAMVSWHDGGFSENATMNRNLRTWWYNLASVPRAISLAGPRRAITKLESYGFTMCFPSGDGAAMQIANLELRKPTEGESWLAYGGNSYFFFSMTLASAAPVHVDTGTELDVWFPFVLDPSKKYSLTVAHADPIVGPLDGSLQDNTLHFVLPAFAVAPGSELMGEIEGDAYEYDR